MKKKVIYCTIITCVLVFTANLNCKSLMPGLARLKNKVENALNGPKTSFKEFLEKAKTAGNQIFINGQSAESLKAKAFEDEIKEIEAIFNKLYWCKQETFAKELAKAQGILSLLKSKFKEKYPNAKSPLITFASDLSQEGESLNVVKGKIEKAANPVKQFSELEKRYVEFAQLIEKYMATLNDIIKATDSL